MCPNWDFWYANIPSGNPAPKAVTHVGCEKGLQIQRFFGFPFRFLERPKYFFAPSNFKQWSAKDITGLVFRVGVPEDGRGDDTMFH
jgi:hypothetical protein